MSDTMDKGEGRGKGKWTARGMQLQQQDDIDALKQFALEAAARLDALEAGEEPMEPQPEEPAAG